MTYDHSRAGLVMMPLAIDIYAGLGGWSEGLLAEGYRVVGFDIEQHVYGEARYPAQLVLQDALTIHGSQFKDAALIVASPPCQAYSYMAMPWSRAKQIEREYRDGTRDVRQLTALFDACFRIQREACEAAGRHIPMVVENVCGAQKWVGRSQWNFGSFHLWGDVPALMPIVTRVRKGKSNVHFHEQTGLPSPSFHGAAHEASVMRHDAIKNNGGSWFNVANNTTSGHGQNQDGRKASPGGKDGWFGDYQAMKNGIKQHGSGREWFAGDGKISRISSSKSSARKAASAHIAKIPQVLARWVARAWHPEHESVGTSADARPPGNRLA